jgi:hypothetical protein
MPGLYTDTWIGEQFALRSASDRLPISLEAIQISPEHVRSGSVRQHNGNEVARTRPDPQRSASDSPEMELNQAALELNPLRSRSDRAEMDAEQPRSATDRAVVVLSDRDVDEWTAGDAAERVAIG